MGLRDLLQRLLGRPPSRESDPPGPAGGPSLRHGDLEMVPASRSRARAVAALGERPSGAGPALLVPPDLTHLADATPPEAREYGPDAAVEWVLDLPLADGDVVTTAEVEDAFPASWRQENSPLTLYGIPEGGARWTYVHAGGAPTRWRSLAISKELVDRDDADAVAATSHQALQAFHDAVETRAGLLGGRGVAAREPSEVASARAQAFAAAWREASLDALVVLRAPAGGRFEGRRVWDVLCGLGLEWGDMDLFHWPNPSEVGHDSFFAVWTSTPPGYFLPEAIRDGRLAVEDLVFGFQIARSAAPDAVLTELLKAARQAEAALGGRLEDERGAPFVETTLRKRVSFVVRRLGRAGLSPGHRTTLRIF